MTDTPEAISPAVLSSGRVLPQHGTHHRSPHNDPDLSGPIGTYLSDLAHVAG